MSQFSEAENYLVEQIKQGSQDGWSQLVQRYQGRLRAFARKQLASGSDADDVVQETFLSFLKGLSRFESKSSLETYLFTILRRRLVDFYRRKGRRHEVLVCDSNYDSSTGERAQSLADRAVDLGHSASWQLQHAEATEAQQDALRTAVTESMLKLQDGLRFRDLKIFELIFFAQVRNKNIATAVGLNEKQVALIKHRFVKRIARRVTELINHAMAINETDMDDDLLSNLWQDHRPSCPKRTTVGKLLLGTLDDEWQAYVDFHINELGCRFCLANLDDLREQSIQSHKTFCDRMMQSSVGFFQG